jgi:hypothetical protein
MKKPLVVTLLIALMLSTGGFLILSHAQSPGTDLKPSFISRTPGLYVNGWPAFAVSYPREWVELLGLGVFRAGGTRPDPPPGDHLPQINVTVFYGVPLPVEDWAKLFMPFYTTFATDIKVFSDKPSQLTDGTPVREVEMEYVLKKDPKPKWNDFTLITKKESLWVWVIVSDDKGRIGEDLKKYAYSLTFLRGGEEPVPVPPDVRTFFDMWCTDTVSHDVKTIMAHFSTKFLHTGYGKAKMEQFLLNDPLSPLRQDFISSEPTVTLFEPRGDRVYVDGFFLNKTKANAKGEKIPMMWQQIIKEQGQWKWYGNQK